MTLEKVYDELISMIEDLRSGQRLADSAIADLQKETQGAQRSTGNPIVIDAAPVNAEALTVLLEPKQAGTGDPSPENIRPITGYTAAEVSTADAAADPTATNTASITFGQTVYGGCVDFKAGTVTIDRAYVDMGSLTFTYASGDHSHFVSTSLVGAKAPATNATKANIKCSAYVTDTANAIYNHQKDDAIGMHTCGNLWVYDSTYTDADTFMATLDGVMFVYELAEPTTLQLTPAELKLLKGTNHITSNGTTIQLTYQPNNVLGQILAESEAYADSVVTITPALESGTKLADYTISGTAGIIYGPGETQATRKTTTKKSTKEV